MTHDNYVSGLDLTHEQRQYAREHGTVRLTPEQQDYMRRSQEEAMRERPQVDEQFRRMRQAAAEPTVSGTLRRAAQRSGMTLPMLAEIAGLSNDQLSDFLQGLAPLPSDAIDRLATTVGLQLTEVAAPPSPLPT